jgi:nuclear protein localization family protein 4
MIIRVRTNIGVWRVENLDPATATPSDVLAGIAATRPHVVYERPLSSDPRCDVPLDASTALSSQGFGHGSMIHCRVEASTCAENTIAASSSDADVAAMSTTDAGKSEGGGGGGGITKRVIGKDGSIRLVHTEGCSVGSERGFRKGMLPLRDMKMAWTLAEFSAMDEKYNFKIKRQDASFVGGGGLHLESSAVNDFQSYLRRFQFQQQRFGYLYGRFVNEEGVDDMEETEKEKKRKDEKPSGWGARMPENETKQVKKNAKVIVEAIYEPPQESDSEAAEGFVILEDPNEENVENLASMLGLCRVGWIVGHPPREEGFQLSSAEVIMAAELQLESAGGIEPTPFVTVRVTVGDDGNVVVEAFQVSLQCMEMVAEEALDVGPNPGFCYVSETFTAIQEGKASVTVENNFFLTLVPINGYQSDTFVSMFPRANRAYDDRAQTHDEMRRQLSKSGQSGWTFVDLLSDFALLLYLCKFLDVGTDMPKICASVIDRENVPLDDGYKIIISSMAGMDGSY